MNRSTVRSQPLGPTTKVIPAHSVETGAVVMLWLLAIALWLLSTFGNFVQFIGGWEYAWPTNQYTGKAVLYALTYQAIFTLAQWGFKAKRWWFLYGVALLASAIPSFLTYNAWANDWIVAHAGASVPPDVAALLTGLLLLVVAIVVDLIPEWVLVE